MTNIDAARLPAIQHPEAASRRDAGYMVIRYNADAVNGDGLIERDQTFQIPGDHVHVIELVGADVIGIATGAKERGFIPLHAGDTFRRPFDRFTIRNYARRGGALTLGGSPRAQASALLLVSFGPVLSREFPKPKDFHAGFPTWQGVATTDGVDVFTNIPFGWTAVGVLRVVNPMRFGGTLLLKNLDMASPIWIYSGAGTEFRQPGVNDANPSALHSWRLDAGETLTLVSESSLRHVNGNGSISTVCAACDAGAAPRFSCMLSRYVNAIEDPDGSFPDGSGTLFVVP